MAVRPVCRLHLRFQRGDHAEVHDSRAVSAASCAISRAALCAVSPASSLVLCSPAKNPLPAHRHREPGDRNQVARLRNFNRSILRAEAAKQLVDLLANHLAVRCPERKFLPHPEGSALRLDEGDPLPPGCRGRTLYTRPANFPSAW